MKNLNYIEEKTKDGLLYNYRDKPKKQANALKTIIEFS